MRYRLTVVLCLAGLLIASAPAFAQTTTGDIVGTVSDESGGVLPGVTVTLTGEYAAGSFTSVTSGRGLYRFSRLHPGFYDLSFGMEGFSPQTRTGLRVTLGATAEENVTLSLGALTEEVTITADSVVVDATNVGMSNAFDKEMVSKLPTRRSSVYDLMATAPGITQVTDNSGAGVGHGLMSMGSETDANSFQLDGISTTSRSQGRVWLFPSPDIVEEVEIITLGAPAEYGHVPGAVFNVITRQGSNVLHGDVSYYHRSDGLMGRNTDEDYDNGLPYYVDHFHDLTASLGGPIVKDKLWFFGSIQHKRNAFSGASSDPAYPNNYTTKGWLGKLNWQINPNHKIVAKYNYDDHNEEYSSGAYRSNESDTAEPALNPTPSISYTGLLSDSTMLEARYGGFYATLENFPLDPNVQRGTPVYNNSAYGGLCSEGPCQRTGGYSWWYALDETSTSVNVALTHFADDFLGGSHDFKFGVQYLQAGRPNAVIQYVDWFGLYLNDAGEEYVWGYDYSPFTYSGVFNNRAVFFDDTFRVNDRLTLKLGLRYDKDWGSQKELPEVDSLGYETGQVASPAIDDLFGWSMISPRVGLTYSLTEDGKTIFRAGYGRYGRGIVTMDFAGSPGNIATTDLAAFTGYYDVEEFMNCAGQSMGPDCTLVGDGRGTNIGGAGNVAMDPDIEGSYTDQYVLGLERELFKDLGLALTYVHKRGENFPAWREVAGTYETFEYTEPITGLTNTLYALTSDPEEREYLLGSPDGMYSRVNAFNVTLNKRMSNNWQLISTLQLQRNTGALASQKTQNGYGRQDGGVAWRPFGKSPNDYVNIGGRLIGDMPVSFKVMGFYELPAGFLVGANYLYQSGGAWAPERRLQIPGLGREYILLQEKDGSDRWESMRTLDLRFQWTGNWGERASLSLFADGYNVTNSNAGTAVWNTVVTDTEFGRIESIILPRRLQLGATFRF